MKQILLISIMAFWAIAVKGQFCPTPGSFSVNQPSAGNITSTSVTLSWGSSTLATGYQVMYKLSTASSYVNGCGHTALSCTTSGLIPGATYNFKVQSTYLCDGTIVKTRDSGNIVTVTMNGIGTPSGLSNSSVDQTSFTANWNSVAGATSYSVEVRTSVGNNLVTTVTSTTNSKNITSLATGTGYSWKVRAQSSASTSSYSSPITVTTVPDTPVASAASNIQQTGFTASWSSETGATGYKLDVSASGSFSSFVSGYNNLTVSTTSRTVTGLSAGTTYYYRVRSANGGTSPNSNVVSVITIPPNPIIADATEITQISFLAHWNAALGAEDYRLDVSNDNFNSFLPDFENVTVDALSLTVGGLTFGETYQYRVRAHNDSGTSDNSGVMEVTLTPGEPVTQAPTSIQTSQFTANWTAVAGAISYRLDVSTSDSFNSFLPGYNNKTVTGTSGIVYGLTSGSSYYYRVRSLNDGGMSGNSNVTNAVTLTSAPVALPATSVAQTSLTARWEGVTGANDYRLDVSADNFNSFVTGFNNAVVTGTSVVVNGLSPGNSYQYRVRSANTSGSSANSDVIETLLKPADPILNDATAVGQNSFEISWSPVTGATSYQLDVATNASFTNFILGYQNKTVTIDHDEITGLSPGFTYYVRLRAVNTTGASANSVTHQQITVPNPPATVQTKEAFANQFVANWPEAIGATFYEVEVSANDAFSELLPGFNPKRVEGQAEVAVQSLAPSTIYFVRVRAGNEEGVSGFSIPKAISTLNGDGSNNFEITIGTPSFNGIFQPEGSNITVTITGGLPDKSVKFHHRPVVEGEFEALDITSTSSPFSISVDPTWLDELGMEFFFSVEDANQTKTSSTRIMKNIRTANAISTISFGGDLKNYRIISIPYAIENNVVDNVFEPILGSYDKGKWRLVRYQGGKNVDYAQGLSKTKFDRGKGFWFNSLNEVTLTIPSSAQIGDNTRDDPFQIVLEAGWNQIGNPYPFSVDWSAVQQFNEDVNLGELLGYNPEKLSLEVITQLKAFEGGFVFCDEPIAFKIPVTARVSSQGARKSVKNGRSSNDGWMVPITISQGEMTNNLSGFGMSSQASVGKDKLDMPVAPRFIRYLELESVSDMSSVPVAFDMVPLDSRGSWTFRFKQNGGGNVSLSWDASEALASLILIDEKDNVVLDMHQASHYSFDGVERDFRILYGAPVSEIENGLKLGAPYPNPATDFVTIPWAFAGSTGSSAIIRVSTLTGVVVYQELLASGTEGLQEIKWNLQTQNGVRVQPGLYLYELIGSQPAKVFKGRVIVK
ncbi:MAG: fibronectin type III domain-containing protein [Cyclobacteriaceae bacterium]